MAQPALKPLPQDSDPFYWGSRLVRVGDGNGGTVLREVPLTRDDILDPQEGDMMVQSPRHGWTIRSLAVRLESYLDADDVAVLDDVKMIWADPELQQVAPDVAVVKGLRDKAELEDADSFSEVEQGVRPCLVIEVISQRYREIDLDDKVRIYRQAGVPEYLAVDATKTPVELHGFRRTPPGA